MDRHVQRQLLRPRSRRSGSPIRSSSFDGCRRHADTVTATIGGYASDMDNPDVRDARCLRVPGVVIATLTGSRCGQQPRTGSSRRRRSVVSSHAVDRRSPRSASIPVGARGPSSFVDFHTRTGLAAYWYSSGGAADYSKTTGTDHRRSGSDPIRRLSPPRPLAPAVTTIPAATPRPTTVVSCGGPDAPPAPPGRAPAPGSAARRGPIRPVPPAVRALLARSHPAA